jgi:hypothetical protein
MASSLLMDLQQHHHN